MGSWLQDFRFGFRLLGRSPAFALAVILTLGLGIGLNTCIFNVFYTILVRDLPFSEPERLVAVWSTLPEKLQHVVGTKRNVASYPNFQDWKDQNSVFKGMTAFSRLAPVTVSIQGEPEQVDAINVCPDFFPLLGVQPTLGRPFTGEEHTEGRDAVVIVSHRYWMSRFGGDSNVLGRTMLIDRKPHTVTAVLPDSFHFGFTFAPYQVSGEPDLWRPAVRRASDEGRGNNSLYPIARLKPGVAIEQAQAEMNVIADRLARQYPKYNVGFGIEVVPLHESLRGDHRSLLSVLLVAAGVVLLIGCVNVANLLLSRAVGREKEFAVRSSVGANRSKLARQLLAEGLVYSLMGGGLGLALAVFGDWVISPYLSELVRGIPDLHLHAPVLIFNFGVSILTAIGFSLAPLLRVSRLNLNETLKEGGKSVSNGSNRNRAGSLLVVGQVALALVLLIGATLLLRSFLNLWQVDPGFRPENLISVEIPASGPRTVNPDQQQAFCTDLLQNVSSLPGVESAALSDSLPFVTRSNLGFRVEGAPQAAGAEIPNADYQTVSAEYLRTVGVPLKRGRTFSPADSPKSPPVIVINEAMARKYWGDQDPIGRRILLGHGATLTVVGVAGNVRQRGLSEEPAPHMYRSFSQRPVYRCRLLVRSSGDPAALFGILHREVRRLDPGQYLRITLVEQELFDSLASPRLVASLLAIFALLALVLSLLGVYGVVSYLVSQSLREVGIRMALGATRARVLGMVLGYGLRRVIAGVVIGAGLSAAVTRVLSSQLFAIAPTDPLTFSGVSLALLLAALAACYLPASRAARTDPMRMLKGE